MLFLSIDQIERRLTRNDASCRMRRQSGPPYGSGIRCLSLFHLFSSLYFLALAEALETTKIHSVVAKLNSQAIIATRPFRSPHHTISDAGLVGGGTRSQAWRGFRSPTTALSLPCAMNYRNSGAQVLEMIGSL